MYSGFDPPKNKNKKAFSSLVHRGLNAELDSRFLSIHRKHFKHHMLTN